MTFRLTHAPATFQAYIDDGLRPYVDVFTMCYHDDIQIYSTNENKQKDHVRKVLERIEEFGLYCQADMCQFGAQKVGSLGFVTKSYGIVMESDRISRIENLPTPELVQDVQVHNGFTNLSQRFIRKYANVTAPIANLLKTQGSRMWEWTQDAKLAFPKLKKAFTEAPILQHFNPQRPITLQTDSYCFTIACILNQSETFVMLHAVRFYS